MLSSMLSSQSADSPLSLGWLSSGRGAGSRSLLAAAHDAIQDGSLSATIEYVLCSRAHGEADGSDEFLTQAARYGLPTISHSWRAYRAERQTDPTWRDRYNADLLTEIKSRPVDVLVLAGLMLILDDTIIGAVPAINLHPALPSGPVGAWQDVIWELISQQARETGVMALLATPETDRGPVLAYCRFPIVGPPFDDLRPDLPLESLEELREKHGESHPLFQAIRQEGLRREANLLVATLRRIADGEITIRSGQVETGAGDPLPHGLDITYEIEGLIAAHSSGVADAQAQ